jgi:hypothetical protein
MQVASVKQSNVCHGTQEKLVTLVQGHVCLYNLQHKHYDNNLVTDNCWKKIAREWQGSGRVVAAERHGNSMVCVNRPLARQANGTVRVNQPLLRLQNML